MIQDMTKGSPAKIIYHFSLPMLLSMIFQQFYNIADSMIAGKYAGMDALSAIGVSYPITMLFLAVASGGAMGCSVVVSQLFGAKNYKAVRTAVSTTLIAMAATALILSGAGLIFCNDLILWIQTPADIFDASALYLRIFIFGVPFLFLYNGATAVFNALGDSKTPLAFLIFSSVLNIFLDLWFVKGLQWGVAGAAWATFLAQGASSVLAVGFLLRKIRTVGQGESFRYFDGTMLLNMGKIAVPSILQQSFISVGQLFVQKLINPYDSAVIAGYSSAFKINTFIVMSLTTMSNALSSFTAQNIGAHRLKRIRQGHSAALIMINSLAVVLVVSVLFSAPWLVGMFLPEETEDVKAALETGVTFLRIAVPFHPLLAWKVCCDAVLKGSGKMKLFMVTTFSDLVLRVVLAYFFEPMWGFRGICWGYPVGWIVGALLSVVFYYSGLWLPRFRRMWVHHETKQGEMTK